MDRNLLGTELRASMFGSLNPLFIIVFAPVFAIFWIWLARKGWEPSTPVKFALGILQAGLGFGTMVTPDLLPLITSLIFLLCMACAKKVKALL